MKKPANAGCVHHNVGAQGRTRTGTDFSTRPSNVRVYQFRHLGYFLTGAAGAFAAGAPLITDGWEGLDRFFQPVEPQVILFYVLLLHAALRGHCKSSYHCRLQWKRYARFLPSPMSETRHHWPNFVLCWRHRLAQISLKK